MLTYAEGEYVDEMPVNPDTMADRYLPRNYPVYKDFISFFVSGVVGIRRFDRNKCQNLYRTYVTISDEAFTVLTLENNLERWNDMAEKEEWKDSMVPSKWTTSKEKRQAENRNKENPIPQAQRYRGWSAQGLARYNQLFEEIKRERDGHNFVEFETYCIAEFQAEAERNDKKTHKRKREEEDRLLPTARHELWDKEVPNEEEGNEITRKIPSSLRDLGMFGQVASL